MTDRGFGLRWRDADEFGTFMADEETSVRELVRVLDL